LAAFAAVDHLAPDSVAPTKWHRTERASRGLGLWNNEDIFDLLGRLNMSKGLVFINLCSYYGAPDLFALGRLLASDHGQFEGGSGDGEQRKHYDHGNYGAAQCHQAGFHGILLSPVMGLITILF
jgi:hypothetical protein